MAVMFKSYAYSGLDFKLENGQQVVCHGSVNIYERDGRYQLYVKEIKLDGIGNLYERYEQLKQKLYEQDCLNLISRSRYRHIRSG